MKSEAKMELKYYQYQRMLEERRGHNYEYWNDEKHLQMLEDGWILYRFETGYDISATRIESFAKSIVSKLRDEGNYARIICGYIKTIQREKHFSIIYKPKS